MSVSDEILKRMADSYRRMRNTLRFLLGNLHGFDPAAHALPVTELVALDRWALARTRAAAGGGARGLPRLRLSSDLPEGPQLLQRRSRRLLSRRHQGPPVHHARRRQRAPLGADARCFTSPRAWCAGWRRSCRSPPRRCGVTCPARAPSRCSTRPGMRLPETPPDAIDWQALIALRGDVTRELEKLRDAGASARRSMRASTSTARPGSSRASPLSARSCASC